MPTIKMEPDKEASTSAQSTSMGQITINCVTSLPFVNCKLCELLGGETPISRETMVDHAKIHNSQISFLGSSDRLEVFRRCFPNCQYPAATTKASPKSGKSSSSPQNLVWDQPTPAAVCGNSSDLPDAIELPDVAQVEITCYKLAQSILDRAFLCDREGLHCSLCGCIIRPVASADDILSHVTSRHVTVIRYDSGSVPCTEVQTPIVKDRIRYISSTRIEYIIENPDYWPAVNRSLQTCFLEEATELHVGEEALDRSSPLLSGVTEFGAVSEELSINVEDLAILRDDPASPRRSASPKLAALEEIEEDTEGDKTAENRDHHLLTKKEIHQSDDLEIIESSPLTTPESNESRPKPSEKAVASEKPKTIVEIDSGKRTEKRRSTDMEDPEDRSSTPKDWKSWKEQRMEQTIPRDGRKERTGSSTSIIQCDHMSEEPSCVSSTATVSGVNKRRRIGSESAISSLGQATKASAASVSHASSNPTSAKDAGARQKEYKRIYFQQEEGPGQQNEYQNQNRDRSANARRKSTPETRTTAKTGAGNQVQSSRRSSTPESTRPAMAVTPILRDPRTQIQRQKTDHHGQSNPEKTTPAPRETASTPASPQKRVAKKPLNELFIVEGTSFHCRECFDRETDYFRATKHALERHNIIVTAPTQSLNRPKPIESNPYGNPRKNSNESNWSQNRTSQPTEPLPLPASHNRNRYFERRMKTGGDAGPGRQRRCT